MTSLQEIYPGGSNGAGGSAGGDLTGTYPNPTIAAGVVDDTNVAAANKDGVAATPSMRTLGTATQQAVAGDDARLSNNRDPNPHATMHVTAGQDLIPVFTTSTPGLVPAPGGTPAGILYLNDRGLYTDPAVSAGGMSNPFLVEDDILIANSSLAPARLPKGADNLFIGVDPVDHRVKYRSIDAGVVSDHNHNDGSSGGKLSGAAVDTYFDIQELAGSPSAPGADVVRMYGKDVSGATHLFTMNSTGVEIDHSIGGGGFTNPMATQDDIIIGGASGVATRLAKGADSQVLTVDPTTHHLVWANSAGGFSNPMTTIGDMIVRNGSNVTARLGIGSSTQFMGVTGGIPAWKALPAFGIGQNGVVVGPGGIGDLSQFLRVDGAWATPSGSSSGGGSGGSGSVYTKPFTVASGHWTQHNFGGVTTATDTPNGIRFDLASQSGSHVRALLEAPPAGSTWAVNTKFNMNILNSMSAPMAGIVMRDSATGHTMYFNAHYTGGTFNWAVHHANDSDGSGEAADNFAALPSRVVPWLQVRQTATQWIFETSNDDGQSWIQVHSMAIGTNVATLDGIGPFVNPENTNGWNATCVHWGYGTPSWAAGSSSGSANPMTAQDDIIIGGASGVATRLAKGADSQVLTVDPSTHHLVWAAPSGGSGSGDPTIAPYVPPVLASLTQLNINGSNQTATQVGSTLVLTSAGAGGNDLSVVYQAAPSAHFQITIALRQACGGPASAVGVCFRESSSGKLAFIYLIPSNGAGGYNWGVNLNTNPTTFDRGVRGATGIFAASPYWFRLRYDGTSMRVLVSATGNANEFSTHDVWSPGADLGWTAPNGAGVVAASNGSSIQATAQVLSWYMEALA